MIKKKINNDALLTEILKRDKPLRFVPFFLDSHFKEKHRKVKRLNTDQLINFAT